jgi:hypothetical protein
MLHHLYSLNSIIQPGVILERKEVIKRCRSLASFDQKIFQLLCMTEFFMLYSNEKGDIYIV